MLLAVEETSTSGRRRGTIKDSLANARATTANLCSAELPADVNEWALAIWPALPSEDGRPERVAAAPPSFECPVLESAELSRMTSRRMHSSPGA